MLTKMLLVSRGPLVWRTSIPSGCIRRLEVCSNDGDPVMFRVMAELADGSRLLIDTDMQRDDARALEQWLDGALLADEGGGGDCGGVDEGAGPEAEHDDRGDAPGERELER